MAAPPGSAVDGPVDGLEIGGLRWGDVPGVVGLVPLEEDLDVGAERDDGATRRPPSGRGPRSRADPPDPGPRRPGSPRCGRRPPAPAAAPEAGTTAYRAMPMSRPASRSSKAPAARLSATSIVSTSSLMAPAWQGGCMARYFDVHPVDPQPRAIGQAVAILRPGGLIAYPTDSCFALGCSLDNPEGKERILRIRHLDDKHHFTLVCSDFAQMGQFVHARQLRLPGHQGGDPGALHVHPPRDEGGAAAPAPREEEDRGRAHPRAPRRPRAAQGAWVSRSSRARCSCPTTTSR